MRAWGAVSKNPASRARGAARRASPRGDASVLGWIGSARDASLTPMLIDAIHRWLIARGISNGWADLLTDVTGLVVLVLAMFVTNFVARRVILRSLDKLVRGTSSRWDDVLQRNGVFSRLSHIAPALVLTSFGPRFFARQEGWIRTFNIGVSIYLVVIVLIVVDAVLDASVDIYQQHSTTRRLPIKGFTQGAKLVSVLLGGIFILSIAFGRSPLYFLSGLGALTAVLLLIFKDALLGLVAGIQISVNQMVSVGDWIEMPKYGADGDVIDVSLTVVKVRNWDKTITTVPTYALISDPVKNWRGMQESGGRRIKRAIYLDMQAFRFVDDALLAKLMTFKRLRPYLEAKLAEIHEYNAQHGDLDSSVLVNGRRLTNVGCFRAYVTAYLRAHPQIRQDMTFLVRQLAPTEKGLPLELYVFTSDTRWAVYEGIQADAFDHLLTVLPEFGLRVYQAPSGYDVRDALGAAIRDTAQRTAEFTATAAPRLDASAK